MKKIVLLLITVSFAFSLFGCENKDEQSNSDINDISSDISEVSQTETTKKLVSKTIAKNGTGEITQTNEIEYNAFGQQTMIKTVTKDETVYNYITYDKNGYESEYITKNEKGEIQAHHQYERYDDGYVKVWRALDKNGNVLNEYKIDLEYDDQGRKVKVYTDGELSQYYTYDEQGNATERRPNTEAYNIYDKDNNKIEAHDGDYHMVCSYEDGKPIEARATRGENTYITAYEYDGDLLLTQTNYENGEVTLKYIYEYDADGDVIKQTTQNALGIATNINVYEYAEFPIDE